MGVHPRACGGAPTTGIKMDSLNGPSPRVRGSLSQVDPPLPFVRSIPARAGEPLTRKEV